MGASQIPLPSAVELKAFLGDLSRSQTVREMARRKWLRPVAPAANDRVGERGAALLEFLTMGRTAMPSFAMFKGRRPSPKREYLDEVATCAWLIRISGIAEQTPPASKFRSANLTAEFMRSIAKLSTKPLGPRLALGAVREVGICVVVEGTLPAMSVDGASFHTQQLGPVLALTLRHDRLDNFWFTLFHELGHICLHLSQPNDDVFVDSEEDEDEEIEAEAEANAFAKDCLVPRDIWLRSEARRFGNATSVVQLAKHLGIHPAIVAGRFRYESRKFWMFPDLIGMGRVREAIYNG